MSFFHSRGPVICNHIRNSRTSILHNLENGEECSQKNYGRFVDQVFELIIVNNQCTDSHQIANYTFDLFSTVRGGIGVAYQFTVRRKSCE